MDEADQTSGFKVKERRDGIQSDDPFKVKAIRRTQSTGAPESYFRARDVRRSTPEEIASHRQRVLQETIQNIRDEARSLPVGQQTSLDVRPHLQQSNDTCMIACTIAIREAIARSKGETIGLNEQIIASEARRLNLLAFGGMATTARGNERQASLQFLEERTGVKIQPLLGLEPPEVGRACVNAIRERNIPLLNSFGHWVAIFGLDKRSDQDINWRIADPLRAEPRILTTPELSKLFIGSTNEPIPVAGEIYIAEGPGNPGFTALRKR